MSRILVVGDDPRKPTGYGKVTLQIQKYLADEHQVFILAYQAMPTPIAERGFIRTADPGLLMTNDSGILTDDLYGRYSAPALIIKLGIDIVITVGDPWYFPYIETVRKCLPHVHYVSYFPSEAYTLPYDAGIRTSTGRDIVKFNRLVDMYDTIIAYSKSTMEQLDKKSKSYIYHSFDDEHLSCSQDIDLSALDGKFVIGTVLRTQYRKGIDQMFYLLQLIKEKDPTLYQRTILYMHSARLDVTGMDVRKMAEVYGVNDHLMMAEDVIPGIFRAETGQVEINNGLSRGELNTVMRRFDIYFAPSYAEGFNLPLIEAAALGVPVMYSNMLTMGEIMDGAGYPMPISTKHIPKDDYRICAMPNIQIASDMVIKHAKNGKPLGYREFDKSRFTDESISKRWRKAITELKKPSIPSPRVAIVCQSERTAGYFLQPILKRYQADVDAGRVIIFDNTMNFHRDLPTLVSTRSLETIEIVHGVGSVDANFITLLPDRVHAARAKQKQIELILNIVSTDTAKLKGIMNKYNTVRIPEFMMKTKAGEPEIILMNQPMSNTRLETLLLPEVVVNDYAGTKMFLGSHEDNLGLMQALKDLDMMVIIRNQTSTANMFVTEGYHTYCRTTKRKHITDALDQMPKGATIYRWNIPGREHDFYWDLISYYNKVITGTTRAEADLHHGDNETIVCENVAEFIDKIKTNTI